MLSKITSIKCIDLFIVNLVVPRQLRIARVVDVRSDEIKIVYNGFDDKYAYWVEDDSPDIHPVGWLAKTNHPIELPPGINILNLINEFNINSYIIFN